MSKEDEPFYMAVAALISFLCQRKRSLISEKVMHKLCSWMVQPQKGASSLSRPAVLDIGQNPVQIGGFVDLALCKRQIERYHYEVKAMTLHLEELLAAQIHSRKSLMRIDIETLLCYHIRAIHILTRIINCMISAMGNFPYWEERPVPERGGRQN